jgi:hypothetical protein
MNLRRLLVLTLIVGGLLSFIYVYELPKEEATKKAEKFLGGVTLQLIESIKISSPSRPTFELFNRSPKESDNIDITQWELRQNGKVLDLKVDEGNVSSLVRELTSLTLKDPLPADELDKDLSIYGLEKPLLDLNVQVKGNPTPFVIFFGKDSEYTQKRYLKRGGDTYLLSEGVFSGADREAENFRSKSRLEQIAKKSLTEVKLNFGGKEVILLRKDDDWRLSKPYEAKASADKVAELTREARALQVKNFLSADSKEVKSLNNKEPTLVISLNGEKYRLLSSTDDKGTPIMYLAEGDSPYAFSIEGNSINKFALEADTLRDKHFISVNSSSIKKFTVSQSKGAYSAVLVGDKWEVSHTEKVTGDKTFIDGFLQGISDLEAIGFPATSIGGNENFKEGGEQVTLEIAPGDKLDGEKSVASKPVQILEIKIGRDLSHELLVENLLTSYKEEHRSKKLPIYLVAIVRDKKEEGQFIVDETTYRKLIPNLETLLPTKKDA